MADPDFDDCPDLAKAAPSLLAEFEIRLDSALAAGTVDQSEIDAITSQIEPFQNSPQLLDPLIERTTSKLCKAYLEDSEAWHTRILYVVVKIRGPKVVCRFFPNDVDLVEKILTMTEQSTLKTAPNFDKEKTWEERYVLFLWLSVLMLSPFKLNSVGNNIAHRAFDLAVYSLSASGREREAATTVMARLITRDDVLDDLFPLFLSAFEQIDTSFQALGVASTVAQLLVLCPANLLQPYMASLSNLLTRLKKNLDISNTALRKILVKVSYRLALASLTLSSSEVPVEVENCVNELLYKNLSDRDSLVRYSASKAFSKVAAAVKIIDPTEIFLCELIDSLLLTSFPDISNSSATDSRYADRWHGGLLALAELLRRRAFPLPRYSSQLLSKIQEGLKFEILRSTHAIGANVRDASCYIAWSLFRHYPELTSDRSLDTYHLSTEVLQKLLLVTSFDREINNRRAAAAAVQECIGRHPTVVDSLEKGMAILQALDYFALGNRSHAYFSVGKKVQELEIFDEGKIVEFLIDNKVCSWDIDVRRLAAESIALLSSSENSIAHYVDLLIDLSLKSFNTGLLQQRHGYLYCLGCLLSNLEDWSTVLSPLYNLFNNLTFPVHEANVLYEAALLVIGPAMSHFYARDHDVPKSYLDILNSVLSRTEEDSQTSGIHKRACSVVESMPLELIDTSDWIDKGTNGKFGYLLALGSYPSYSSEVTNNLMNIASSTQQVHHVISRVAAIQALAEIFSKFDIPGKVKDDMINAICCGLQDYTTLSTRGDIGSQLRLSSMLILKERTIKLFPIPSAELEVLVVTNLVRISLEKMDKLRTEAVETLKTVIPLLATSVEYTDISKILSTRQNESQLVHSEYFETTVGFCWCHPSVVARSAILGLAASAGGTTGESVVRSARDAIISRLALDDGSNKAFVDSVVSLFIQKPDPKDRIMTTPTPPKREYELCELVTLLFECYALTEPTNLVATGIYNKASKLYLLALRQSSVQKLDSMISLFASLAAATQPGTKVRELSVAKITTLLTSNIKKVRQSAADALFLLSEDEEHIFEIRQSLTAVQWTECEDVNLLEELSAKVFNYL
ncbi:armadillo-type protein, partial [Lipomyces oligophaga]|uniref:armadillo-type protein n=1 Tax=Lipomyces oligophaga TaxID=45792 RepID=UPI0034CF75AC